MTDRELNIVGPSLQELRKSSGFTLERLAAKRGLMGWDVTGQTLAKIEAQKRSVFDCELIVLQRALNVASLFPEKIDGQSLMECLKKPWRR